MASLLVHLDAIEDLQQLKTEGHLADYGVLLAFLQQARADMRLLQTLEEDWFGEDGTAGYSVKKVVSMHRRGRAIWRLKVLTPKGLSVGHRILYAIDPRAEVTWVLGVLPRAIAYEQQHPRVQRILAVYDSLGIP